MLKLDNFKVYVLEDYELMGKQAAEIIAAQINEKANSVLGFATGSTPESTYSALIEMYKAGKVDFSQITTFNLDEYYPIKKSEDQSYDYFMKQKLFNHVNVNPESMNIPNGEAVDADAECAKYEEKIKNVGGIDLQILGIGGNGHIGFNEPGDVFEKQTHRVSLAENTIKDNARFFESEEDVPRHALSMGIKTIMQAKKILLLVSGEKKADILKQTLLGDITPNVPASALQLHRDVSIVADKSAAKWLQ